MIKHLFPAVMLTVLMTALTGLAYPLAMTGLAQRLFPYQANGSLEIGQDGAIIGSALIGQSFTREDYFHGRPSATGGADPNDATKSIPAPYNASNSAGSNLGPTSKALIERVKEESEALKAQNPSAPVPVDLVTTSASGLDPDITPAAALFQIPRIAKARKLSEDALRSLVEDNTTGRLLGILGEPHVNVLKLNLALDKAFPTRESRKSKENSATAEATPAPAVVPSIAAPPALETPATTADASPVVAAPAPPAPVVAEAAASAPAIDAPVAPAVAPPSANPPKTAASEPVAQALFPSEISSAHADKKPSVARLKTCSDQFRANAATNSNGGLKWMDYWSACKKRLKG